MKTVLIHLSAYFLCFLVGCATMSKEEKQFVENRDRARQLEDEINIGRSMAAKLLGHFGAFENEIVLRYVNQVGQAIALRVGRPDIKFRFGVVNLDEFNAFATPGGYVFVSTGLLKAVESESQLAGVLAHEIAHINERHMYEELRPQTEVGVENSVARILSRGQAEIGKSISQVVSKGLSILLEKGIAPAKEQEADIAGMSYLVSAGYRPSEYVQLFQRLPQSKQLKLSKTAGDLKLRAKFLAENLELLGEAGGAELTELASRFRRSLSSLR